MSIIPPFVQNVIIAYIAPLLDWFSERVYADLIRRASDHLLVQLHDHLDLAPLEEACASFHHSSGPGKPATHTVPRLVRALLVKYLYDHSLRSLEHEIRFQLIVKWFVGYPIGASGPDHSTLDRFEQWVCENQRRIFFDQTLRQIDEAFPEQRQQPQIGDTFAMQANAARESLVPLIRHLCRRLLTALHQADAHRAARLREQIDLTVLFPENEVDEYYLSPEKRAQRLHTTVCAALDCAQHVRDVLEQPVPLDAETRAPVLQWLDLLDKAITDDLLITRDEQGQITPGQRAPGQRERFLPPGQRHRPRCHLPRPRQKDRPGLQRQPRRQRLVRPRNPGPYRRAARQRRRARPDPRTARASRPHPSQAALRCRRWQRQDSRPGPPGQRRADTALCPFAALQQAHHPLYPGPFPAFRGGQCPHLSQWPHLHHFLSSPGSRRPLVPLLCPPLSGVPAVGRVPQTQAQHQGPSRRLYQ